MICMGPSHMVQSQRNKVNEGDWRYSRWHITRGVAIFTQASHICICFSSLQGFNIFFLVVSCVPLLKWQKLLIHEKGRSFACPFALLYYFTPSRTWFLPYCTKHETILSSMAQLLIVHREIWHTLWAVRKPFIGRYIGYVWIFLVVDLPTLYLAKRVVYPDVTQINWRWGKSVKQSEW